MEELGGFGVPIIVFPATTTRARRAIFGPVVVPAPMDDDALALWDLTLAYRRIEGLYEIKTPKTKDDLAFIARAFTPYLQGRDWESVQNPAP